MRELPNLEAKVIIILAGVLDTEIIINSKDIVIAVDGGYEHAQQLKIKPNIVIGDFDSIKSDFSEASLELEKVKDDTDFAVSLDYVQRKYPEFPIEVYGFASLNRIDHVINNIAIIRPGIIFISKNQRISCYQNGFNIEKSNYKYISFYALTPIASLSLKGFKYNVDQYPIKPFDPLFISNEIELEVASVEFANGNLVVIESAES